MPASGTRARTAEEIAENYDNLLNGAHDGLVSNWHMDEPSGTTVADSTGTNDGTLATDFTRVDVGAGIKDSSFTVEEGQAVTGVMGGDEVNGTASFRVLDGASAEQTSYTIAGEGTVTIDGTTGRWTFTPLETFSGTATFTLRAKGSSDSIVDDQQISVTVTADAEQSVQANDGVLDLDYAADYAEVTHHSDFDFGTGAFSVEAWVKVTVDDGNEKTIVSKIGDEGTNIGSNAGWALRTFQANTDNNNSLEFWTQTNATTYTAVYADEGLKLDQWHHVAGVREADGSLKLFIDGVEATTTERTGNGGVGTASVDNTLNLRIGNDTQSGNNDEWGGQIDEVRIWNDARTGDEILDTFNEQLTPANEANLVSYYRFGDTSEPGTVQDLKSGHDATLVGDAQIVSGVSTALKIDSDSDTVAVTSVTGDDLNGSSFTWEFWAHRDAADGIDLVLGMADSGADNNQSFLHAGWTSSTNFRFSFDENGGDGEQGLDYTDSGSVGEWAHWAGSYDTATNTMKLYKNGVLVASKVYSPGDLNVGSGHLVIGNGAIGASQGFNGLIDNVRIWNDVRSDDEIAANFNKTIIGDDANLLANYRFEESSGAAVDSATGVDGSNDGTLQGGAARVEAGPPIHATSIIVQEDEGTSGTFSTNDLADGTVAYAVTGGTTANGVSARTFANQGTVSIDTTTGRWSFDPVDGFHGDVSASFTATANGVTDTENVTFTVKNEPDDSADVSGGFLTFDGTGDYVVGQAVSEHQITGDMTMEGWINVASLNTVPQELMAVSAPRGDTGTANNFLFSMQLRTGGDIALVHEDAAQNPDVEVVFDTNLSTGEWVHLSATRDVAANTYTLFINGEEFGTQSYDPGSLGTEDPVGGSNAHVTLGAQIQSNGTDTTRHFFGQMDDVRLWNTKRTAEDIRTTYNQQLNGDETGLVGYWKADDANGSGILNDTTSNNNGLIRKGDTTTVTALGKALNLDGTGDYVSIDSPATVATGDGPLSFETWIRTTSTNEQTIMITSSASPYNDYITLVMRADGTVRLAGNDAGSSSFIDTTATINDGAWHHLAFTYDGDTNGQAKIYIDGNEVLSDRLSATVGNSIAHIGANVLGTFNFTGEMADVRYWSDVRTADEIRDNMDARVPANSSDLSVNYTFDGAATGSGGIADDSSTSNTATMQGDPAVIDATPTIYGNALSVEVGDSLVGTMTNLDVIQGQTATYSINAAASKGTLTIDSATGEYVYTPNADATGTDTFTLRASAGGVMKDEQITVTFTSESVNTTSARNFVELDGVNDHVRLPAIDDLSGAVTLEAWINPESFTGPKGVGWMRIFDLGQGEENDQLILSMNGTTGAIALYSRVGSSAEGNLAQTGFATTHTINTGEWSHIAAVIDGSGGAKIYIDGVERGSQASGFNSVQDVTFDSNFIGRSNSDNDDFFNGSIADVRIWNDARTATEIADNRNVQLTGSEDNLHTLLAFDDVTGKHRPRPDRQRPRRHADPAGRDPRSPRALDRLRRHRRPRGRLYGQWVFRGHVVQRRGLDPPAFDRHDHEHRRLHGHRVPLGDDRRDDDDAARLRRYDVDVRRPAPDRRRLAARRLHGRRERHADHVRQRHVVRRDLDGRYRRHHGDHDGRVGLLGPGREHLRRNRRSRAVFQWRDGRRALLGP
jgi:CshA-type fibril repeat protein